MATILRKGHRRAKPKIKKIEGRWEVVGDDQYTNPELLEKAQHHCRILNCPLRYFLRRTGPS